MLNEELVSAVLEEFGLNKTLDFCILQAFAYKLKAKEFRKQYPGQPNEFEYERDWFVYKYHELIKLKPIANVTGPEVPKSQT